jgi:hypothetical protein
MFALDTIIIINWPNNQTNLEEDTYESPQLVCYKNADALVLVVKTSIEITHAMLESWSDNDEDTLEDVVESSMGVHNEIMSNLQGSPPYYRRRG